MSSKGKVVGLIPDQGREMFSDGSLDIETTVEVRMIHLKSAPLWSIIVKIGGVEYLVLSIEQYEFILRFSNLGLYAAGRQNGFRTLHHNLIQDSAIFNHASVTVFCEERKNCWSFDDWLYKLREIIPL